MIVTKKINDKMVSFSDVEFELVQADNIEYLHYVGEGGIVTQPQGYDNMHAMFIYFSGKELDLSNWDTSNYTNFNEAFSHCENLEVIRGIEDINVSAMVSANSMFCACKKIKTLQLDKWNTNSLVDASGMFSDCISLQRLYVGAWDVTNCTDMSYFVNGCVSLEELPVTNWKTDSLRDVNKFACSCISLRNADVSKWSANLIGDLDNMFANCPRLEKIDFTNWGISELATNRIFYGSPYCEADKMRIF